MLPGRYAIVLAFAILLISACGGGSSSGSGGGFAGICTFSVASNGTVKASVDSWTSDPGIAEQIQNDCRATAEGLTIARNYCGYPLRTRHFPTVERHGDVYGFDRPGVERDPYIPGHELPHHTVSRAAGNYMQENDIKILSCHRLDDRLDALTR